MLAESHTPTTGAVFGDHDGVLAAFTHAGNQTLLLTDLPDGMVDLVGDGRSLAGFAQGGSDELTALAHAARVWGDAFTLLGHARGGHDLVVAGGGAEAYAFGDGELLTGSAIGGDDDVRAGADETAVAYGDAATIGGLARGGHDRVSADGFGTPTAYGDAEVILGAGVGGDDTVTGLSSLHGAVRLFGDAERLEGLSSGGDDLLIAPSGSADMWGDAAFRAAGATTGADRFVFAPTGQLAVRSVMDFEPGKDLIELSGYGLDGFNELASLFQPAEAGVLIVFSGADWVLIAGVQAAQLSAGDFVFS
ncbi:hypothetical protein [Phenylobacterium sp.]|uniref:hypothetical protein n=1 Tax=Phenylobacterium sp. TaxID=1871053 RepID=UPI0035AEC846